MLEPLRIGIVGCGNISGIYFQNGAKFRPLEVVACADLDLDRAKAKAAEHGVAKALTTDALLADPEVELVLNLTVPNAHHAVAKAALEAGKHVYNEKPLSIARADGKELLDLAKSKGLLVGCAPDTFLGAGIQTCRRVIDSGMIGEPIAAEGFMLCHGHESWHPSPEFYYEKGGGPMFDMGPYYLTALVNLVGPMKRVAASARITFPTRTITSQPKRGKVVTVETPTHLSCLIEFANGAVGTVITSFDVWGHKLPNIQVHGTEGSMLVPDPNGFGGQVLVTKPGDRDWREIPLVNGYPDNGRGLGVMDMAYAIRTGRPHRASGDLAYHVLDAFHAFHESSDTGRFVDLAGLGERPAALPETVAPADLGS
ncbi:MAG: Gfo/Idh/MocA family oxidoreductase [Fimbriimonadaceae bacterium]|nr:Gfo/Idh/MocA family oxidoreductase [Fimbriimonadaceae bacterium]